jgi:nucleotide-binding universal stress UspA family protein
MNRWQRILVALDNSPHSTAALEAAAEVAARLQAELVGIFVEDTDLLHLAALPFAREVTFSSPVWRPLDAGAMEQQLQQLAAKARRALSAAADRRQLRWSFRVARGAVGAELLAAAVEMDLLALGIGGWQPGTSLRLGSTAMEVLSRAPRGVLLFSRTRQMQGPLMILDEGQPVSASQVEALRHLALHLGQEMILLSLPNVAKEKSSLWLALNRNPEQSRIPIRDLSLKSADITELAAVLKGAYPGILAFTRLPPWFGWQGLEKLLTRIECPVFLIQGESKPGNKKLPRSKKDREIQTNQAH